MSRNLNSGCFFKEAAAEDCSSLHANELNKQGTSKQPMGAMDILGQSPTNFDLSQQAHHVDRCQSEVSFSGQLAQALCTARLIWHACPEQFWQLLNRRQAVSAGLEAKRNRLITLFKLRLRSELQANHELG